MKLTVAKPVAVKPLRKGAYLLVSCLNEAQERVGLAAHDFVQAVKLGKATLFDGKPGAWIAGCVALVDSDNGPSDAGDRLVAHRHIFSNSSLNRLFRAKQFPSTPNGAIGQLRPLVDSLSSSLPAGDRIVHIAPFMLEESNDYRFGADKAAKSVFNAPKVATFEFEVGASKKAAAKKAPKK